MSKKSCPKCTNSAAQKRKAACHYVRPLPSLAGEFTPTQRIRHDTPPRPSETGIPFPRSPANINPSRYTAPAVQRHPGRSRVQSMASRTSTCATIDIRTREYNSQFTRPGGITRRDGHVGRNPPEWSKRCHALRTFFSPRCAPRWRGSLRQHSELSRTLPRGPVKREFHSQAARRTSACARIDLRRRECNSQSTRPGGDYMAGRARGTKSPPSETTGATHFERALHLSASLFALMGVARNMNVALRCLLHGVPAGGGVFASAAN